MTRVLVRKILRDIRWALLVVVLLLLLFQILWATITKRVLGELSPFFRRMAAAQRMTEEDIQKKLFEGPGQLIKNIIGGDTLTLNSAMDFLSIGYVHPLMQTIFCIWAIGRAAGAIAGETDRGTSELLFAQPVPRSRIVLAHLCTDALTIPLLCLSLWVGTCLGTSLTGPIKEKTEDDLEKRIPLAALLLKETPEQTRQRLEVRLLAFGPALFAVGGLIFGVCGYTMWISSLGRFRWRVLGAAVLLTLLMFLVNLLGQMWDVLRPLRPLTIFYYYRPQQMILGDPLAALPGLVVLYSVGAAGYLMAFRTLKRRDIPAPL